MRIILVSIISIAQLSIGISVASDNDNGPGLIGKLPAQTPFDIAPAYHYRWTQYNWQEFDNVPLKETEISEVWAVHGVGRREEVKRGTNLVRLLVDTPRWHINWDLERNVVLASPSEEEDDWEYLSHPRMWLVMNRQRVIRFAEELTGVAVCQRELLVGREVERITCYFPPNPTEERISAHIFDPKAQLRYPGTSFLTRVYWFDIETGRIVRRECGCKRPSEDFSFDYPTPKRVPKELFRIEIPRSVTLRVQDAALGRSLLSPGAREREQPRGGRP